VGPEKFIAVLKNERVMQSMYAVSRADGGWTVTTKTVFQESAGQDIEFRIKQYQIGRGGELGMTYTHLLTYQCPFCTMVSSSFCDCPLSYRREFLPVVSFPRRPTVESLFSVGITLGNMRANVVSISQAPNAPSVTHTLVAVGHASRPTRETHEIIRSNFFFFDGARKMPWMLMTPIVNFSHISEEDVTVKLGKKKKKWSYDIQDDRKGSTKRARNTLEVAARVSESALITERTHCQSAHVKSSSVFGVRRAEDRTEYVAEAGAQHQRVYLVRAPENQRCLELVRTEEQNSFGSPSVLEASVDEREPPISVVHENLPESFPAVYTDVLEASVDERQPLHSVVQENLSESIPAVLMSVPESFPTVVTGVPESIPRVFTGVPGASVEERQPPLSLVQYNLPETIPAAFSGVLACVDHSRPPVSFFQKSLPESSPVCPTVRPTWDQPATCPVCQKDFRRRVEMDRHLRTSHSNARSHACGQCGKSFKLPHHLKQHCISFHSNAEMLQCPEDRCDYKSRRKGDLMRHRRTIHPWLG